MTTPMSPLRMNYRVAISHRIPYILTIHLNIFQDSDWFDKLHYIYQHFQDSKKMHQLDPETETTVPDDDSLYPYINNDIKYRLFEDIVDSYYLDSQLKMISNVTTTVTYTNEN